MKNLICFGILLITGTANAAAPSTSCPSGFTTITAQHIVLANSACPSGYSAAGSIASCLVSSPSGVCFMYAPTGTSYSDNSGTYEYTEICPLT